MNTNLIMLSPLIHNRTLTTLGIVAASACWLLSLTPAAKAEVILSKDFETLTDGDVNGQGGFTATPTWDVAAPGLGYTNGSINLSGGSKRLTTVGTPDALASVEFSEQTGTFYVGLTVRYNNFASQDFLWIAASNDSDPENSLGVVFRDSNKIQARIRDSAANGQSTGFTFNTTGETYRLVLQISKSASINYNDIAFWVNPSDSTQPGLIATQAHTRNSEIAALDTLWLRLGSTATATGNVSFDDIVVSNTFAAAAIPEPTSLALLMAGGMACLGSRRRRSSGSVA